MRYLASREWNSLSIYILPPVFFKPARQICGIGMKIYKKVAVYGLKAMD
jgi:hypothetical protein